MLKIAAILFAVAFLPATFFLAGAFVLAFVAVRLAGAAFFAPELARMGPRRRADA